MRPTRLMPRIGMAAQVVGDPDRLTVVRVEGPRLVAVGADGTEQAFVIHRLTGHWVREGDPYWGRRLRLGEASAG